MEQVSGHKAIIDFLNKEMLDLDDVELDVNAIDCFGCTIIDLLVYYKYPCLAKELLNQDIDLNKYMDKFDKKLTCVVERLMQEKKKRSCKPPQ